jgi:hypothetical protein
MTTNAGAGACSVHKSVMRVPESYYVRAVVVLLTLAAVMFQLILGVLLVLVPVPITESSSNSGVRFNKFSVNVSIVPATVGTRGVHYAPAHIRF